MVDESCPAGPLAQCDGGLTALPGVPLMTFSADCPLVLAFDPVQRVLGHGARELALHGRRA